MYGNLASAGSTGGNTCKPLGHIGDTAVIGSGISANSEVAVVCSGHGESILRFNVSNTISQRVANHIPLQSAIGSALHNVAQQSGGMPCAVLAMNRHGEVHSQSTGRSFTTASASSFANPQANMAESSIAVLDQHLLFSDSLFRAGLTRYPLMDRHIVAQLRHNARLNSLGINDFVHLFSVLCTLATTVKSIFPAQKYDMVSDGGALIHLITLPDDHTGLALVKTSNQAHDGVDTNQPNPHGTSEMSALQLPESSIAAGTKDLACSEPVFWKTKSHSAVLRGRTGELEYVVSSNRGQDLGGSHSGGICSDLLAAAHGAMVYTLSALDARGCAIVLHHDVTRDQVISLIPLSIKSPHLRFPASSIFRDVCLEYNIARLGPAAKNLFHLELLASNIRDLLPKPRILPPRSWQVFLAHSMSALENDWYKAMSKLQTTFYHACVDFFRGQMSYQYVLCPLTIDCISSPMGLGSDSLPVEVDLLGQKTYLADSMQFTLEYILRINEGLPGAYYVSPSFRGKDPDSTHLNQFYHVECELLGTMDDGMQVMEQFIFAVVQVMMDTHADLISRIAGGTKHIESILEYTSTPGTRFPQVTLDEALNICGEVPDAWEFVVPGAPEKGKKLTRKGERMVMARYGGVVWLTMMDHLSVPFYQAYENDTKIKARCGDLLLGIGELGGLGERHKTVADVNAALLQHEVPHPSYEWYKEIRKHDDMQTVGWGMGMERFMLWLLQHDDVRDISIIPRLKGERFLP